MRQTHRRSERRCARVQSILHIVSGQVPFTTIECVHVLFAHPSPSKFTEQMALLLIGPQADMVWAKAVGIIFESSVERPVALSVHWIRCSDWDGRTAEL